MIAYQYFQPIDIFWESLVKNILKIWYNWSSINHEVNFLIFWYILNKANLLPLVVYDVPIALYLHKFKPNIFDFNNLIFVFSMLFLALLSDLVNIIGNLFRDSPSHWSQNIEATALCPTLFLIYKTESSVLFY